MLVSIIIPYYNAAKFIERVLNSVLSQTYNNYELILVDDCGTDGTTAIVDSYLSKHSEVNCIVIRHETNKGAAAARNTGLAASTGDYILFVDADDEMSGHALCELVSIASKYDGVDLVYGNFIDKKGSMDMAVISDLSKKDFTSYPEYSNDVTWIVTRMFDYSQKNNLPINPVNKLIRRSFLVDNNLYFCENLRAHEDEMMAIDMSLYVSSVAFCNKVTYIHYVNNASIMTSLSPIYSVRAWQYIVLNSYRKFPNLLRDLKLSYCMKELENKYFEVPKKSFYDALKTKSILIKLSVDALLHGFWKLSCSVWPMVLIPFRLARIQPIKGWLLKKYAWKNMLNGVTLIK